MATSSCIKCSSTRFEIKEIEPKFGKYQVVFVQCLFCGAVAGVVDRYNIAPNLLLEKIANKLGISIFDLYH